MQLQHTAPYVLCVLGPSSLPLRVSGLIKMDIIFAILKERRIQVILEN